MKEQMTLKEAAQYLGVTPTELHALTDGTAGPKFYRLLCGITYFRDDLDLWKNMNDQADSASP